MLRYTMPKTELKDCDEKATYENGSLTITFHEDSMILSDSEKSHQDGPNGSILEDKIEKTSVIFHVKLYYKDISEISLGEKRYSPSVVIYANEKYSIYSFLLDPLCTLLNRKLFLFQKRRLEKIESDIQTLLYAPEGGGPLYQEAKQRFYKNRASIL